MSQVTKIAVPTEGPGGVDAPRSAHFGHAGSFTIVEVGDGAIVGHTVIMNPPHGSGGCGSVVQTLAQNGADVAIVVGMGGGPRAAMASCGIDALFDDVSPTPRQAVESYLSGGLTEFGSSQECAGH
jgi:predicted Fe-Mo cluster-binding NifX family protein